MSEGLFEVTRKEFWDHMNTHYPNGDHTDYVYPGGSVYSVTDGTKEVGRLKRSKDAVKYFLVK